jgi:hypothetical protein
VGEFADYADMARGLRDHVLKTLDWAEQRRRATLRPSWKHNRLFSTIIRYCSLS